ERARRKKLPKHGGGGRRIELNEAHRVLESSDDLFLLDEALDRLSAEDYSTIRREIIYVGCPTRPTTSGRSWAKRNRRKQRNQRINPLSACPLPRRNIRASGRGLAVLLGKANGKLADIFFEEIHVHG